MPVHTITVEERNRMTDQAAQLFVERHGHDYFPCPANSQKICDFINSQVGENYPYHWPIEFFENAFAYLSEHSWFYQRPEELEVEDPEQQRALKAANDSLAACKAEEVRIARAMPLSELGKFTSVENAKLREARDRGESPDRPVGQSSRPISTVKLGDKAQARINVATAHPEITDRNGAAFVKLYAAELARLRG